MIDWTQEKIDALNRGEQAMVILEKMDILLGIEVGQLEEVNPELSQYASLIREQLNRLMTLHRVK